ncbi:hypothetical protein [Nostoc sp.]
MRKNNFILQVTLKGLVVYVYQVWECLFMATKPFSRDRAPKLLLPLHC